MKWKMLLIPLFSLLLFSSAYSREFHTEKASFLSFTVIPFLTIPTGDSTDFINLNGGVRLATEYRLPSKPILTLIGDLAYNYLPLKVDASLSVLSFGGGGGLTYYILPRLFLKGNAVGGLYTATVNQQGGNIVYPYVSVKTGINYLLFPTISIGFQASYDNYINLYDGIGIALGTTYHLPSKKAKIELEGEKPLVPEHLKKKGKQLEIFLVEFDDIFPVFFKYYDDYPVGEAVLVNCEKGPISDIEVSLFVKQYMDAPKSCVAPEKLKGGEEAVIDLNALFTEKVLGITEGTKVAAEITLKYTYGRKEQTKTIVETMSLYDRNATTWDDDRKAAAFVTAKDPVILNFAKNVVGLVKETRIGAVNQNIRAAMALHEALSLYGMSYVIDPGTPYEEFSKNKQAVDYLQFPRQTLEYKAGDCDDLSILYSALLESVGIPTAFITIPGHIYAAFSLDMHPDEVKKTFLNPDEFIFIGDNTWIPVEVTELDGGFLKAWQVGAKQWREAKAHEKAAFYPMNDSWAVYNPVGLPGEGEKVELPQETKLTLNYQNEMTKFINREIYPKVTKLQDEIQKSGEDPKLVNKLGILYARYGLIDKAEKEFQKVLAKNSRYVPTLLNLGNVYYLNGEMDRALTYYGKASQYEPENAKALLCVARVHHELENYGYVKKAYDKLKTIDRDLADKFAYLDLRDEDALRAANIAKIKETVLWEE